jgi:beta-galactosidase
VRATIVDARGITIPRARDLVSFTVSEPGVIAAVDNADNVGPEVFQTNSCPAFQGRCVAYVKAQATVRASNIFGDFKTNKTIKMTASAAGLKAASVVLAVAPELSH